VICAEFGNELKNAVHAMSDFRKIAEVDIQF